MPSPLNFRERLKRLVKDQLFPDTNAPQNPADRAAPDIPQDEPATSDSIKLYRIRRAAELGVQLWMKYDNNWRNVDPWSLKYGRARGGAGPMLYGRCSMHPNDENGKPKVEAFRIDRIQDVYLTDRPHQPVAGWTVEIS